MATGPTRDDVRTVPPAVDYRSHERQYRRFLHLTTWFVIHTVIMMPALYFFVIAGQPVAGGIFLGLAVIALVYGIVTTAGIREDVASTIRSATDPNSPPE